MRQRRKTLAMGLNLLAVSALVLCSTESSGWEEWPLPDTWVRCGGPLGGLGYDVRIHPLDPNIMFVTDAFAGVFRSLDGGQSWEPSNNGIPTSGGPSGDAIPAFCLTIDPVNPNVIWTGMQYTGGIYKSTDVGESWTEMGNGVLQTDGITFRGFTVDPTDPDVVYVAGEISSWVWNGGEPMMGREFDMTQGIVYKTLTGGEEWFEIWRGENLARYVWIDPRDTRVLYLSTGIFDREAANSADSTNTPGGEGILKSEDGGMSWEHRNDGLTNLYVGSLFMHPENPDILLAGCANNTYPDSGGVFLTTDGAGSWTRVLNDGVQSVEFALPEPMIAYAGNPSRVHRSTDGGLTWIEVSSGDNTWGPPGVVAGFPIDFQVDPANPDRLFTNNYGGGNFLSVDGGHTWTVASAGYTGAQVRDIAVAPYDPARVYAAARSGFFVSYDSGLGWEGRTYPPAAGLEWNVVEIDPGNPLHMLASNNWMGIIFETFDGAETWEDAGENMPEGKAWRCFTFAPSAPHMIYGGTGAFQSAGQFDPARPALGVFLSPDGGENWLEANDTTSHDAQVAQLAVAPGDPLTVYAASTNKGVMKTTTGGDAWTLTNTGLPANPNALAVTIDPTDSEHVFVGLEVAGLYESANGGLSWQPVPAGLPAEANVTAIVFHPFVDDLVYMADRLSGVYRSTDGGATWIRVNDGLRTRAVNALSFSGDGQILYAATEGEGVFRLDGAGPVVAVHESPEAKTLRAQSYPNPFNPVTTIEFSLPERVQVTLRIFDAGGALVRELLDQRLDSGTHQYPWDGRDDGGRRLASGVYFYRLEAGGLTRTRQMVLVQ